MKMQELMEKKKTKGTYAGVRFSDATKDAVAGFIKEHNIPNGVPADKLHSTLLYSRKFCPDYKATGKLEDTMSGTPSGFAVWDNAESTTNCLVLEYDCSDLVDRHKFLMDEHGATHDFDDFKTHITFSYDIGDTDYKKLPKFTSPIEIVEEYGEDLNLDWAKENT